MANETLTGSSVVINADIPQTIQETLLQTSNVIDKDIVQTIQETIVSTSTVIDKDIPQTIQETSIGITSVIGQVGEKVNTGLVNTGLVIGKSLGKVFCNFGIIKIVITNSQVVI